MIKQSFELDCNSRKDSVGLHKDDIELKYCQWE